MFRISSNSTMPDLFSNVYCFLDPLRQEKLDDKTAWYNLFYEYVTSKVDERPFSKLFSSTMGAPNASIRILVSMMILKEGYGWSDESLFEATQFDLRMMRGLGLNNVSDRVPCLSTYYYLKKAIYEYQVNTGEDLIGEVFKKLTGKQVNLFGVNGKFARMDSKLIGSNIARCTRLQLILSVIQVFYKDIKNNGLAQRISEDDIKLLENLSNKTPGQIVYCLENLQKEELLEELGYLLLRLQNLFTEEDSLKYHLIVRILAEQYSIKEKHVCLRGVKEIKSDSLQSPYEEDAAYRKKNEQEVRGYSINITETCNKGELNLITDPKLEKANYADKDFFQGSIERSEGVVGHIDNVNTDGAYHSEDNQEFAKDNETTLILGGMPGRESKYSFEVTKDEEVIVTNKQTGEIYQVEHCKKTKRNNDEPKYRILEDGKFRYFTLSYIYSWLKRQSMLQTSQTDRNRRNNVEATIFQLCYHTRNNKTRYRGLIKNQIWAYNRCMWINLVRIKNYVKSFEGELCPDGIKNVKITEIIAKTQSFFAKNWNIFYLQLNILSKLKIYFTLKPKNYIFAYNYVS